jgi:hypothetical protein
MTTKAITTFKKPKVSSFSYVMHVGEGTLIFYFEPVFMIKKIKYLVTVLNPIRTLDIFYMEKSPIGWKIINAPKISDEYLEMESLLAKVIERSGND